MTGWGRYSCMWCSGPRKLILSHAAIDFLDLSHFAIILDLGRIFCPIRCCVRIISKKRLESFWKSRKHDSAIAERDFTAWIKLAKNANWRNFGRSSKHSERPTR